MKNKNCYRAQCYATTKLLATELNLSQEEYTISFQSRLGRTPWITPYTDQLLEQIAADGIKNVAVVCPSFVADCLETIEEIGMEAKEQWQQLSDGKLTLIPCINSESIWVKSLSKLVKGK